MTLPCLNRIYTDPASAARRSRAEVPLLLHEAYTRERRSPCLQTKSRSIPTYRLPKPQSNQQQQSAFDSRHTSRADCMSVDPGNPVSRPPRGVTSATSRTNDSPRLVNGLRSKGQPCRCRAPSGFLRVQRPCGTRTGTGGVSSPEA